MPFISNEPMFSFYFRTNISQSMLVPNYFEWMVFNPLVRWGELRGDGRFFSDKRWFWLTVPPFPLAARSFRHCNFVWRQRELVLPWMIRPTLVPDFWHLTFPSFFCRDRPLEGCYYQWLTVYLRSLVNILQIHTFFLDGPINLWSKNVCKLRFCW